MIQTFHLKSDDYYFSGTVHLTGYQLEDNNDLDDLEGFDMGEEEEEDSDNEGNPLPLPC